MTLYRSYRSGDLAGILTVLDQAMPEEGISEETFATTVLLDGNFDPAGLVIVELDDTIVGFLYATSAQRGMLPQPDHGYLTIAAVAPAHQRQGIGSELLHRAMTHLRDRGAARVTIAGYPQGYFVPGIDPVAYSTARALASGHGFEQIGSATAMHRALQGYAIPEEVRALIRRRMDDGYVFAAAGWDDLSEVLTFAERTLAPDWGNAVREAVLASRQPSRIRLVRSPEGTVAGFATYATYGGVRERFGPFGVDPQQRGTGLGKALLHQTLRQMHDEGASRAWFLWTGEDSPAGKLYRSNGFEVTRRFDVMRTELTPSDSPHHRWKDHP
ncbi:GNAT family N-acetyltransferase [Bogoriella caseilytica]|uniref:Acetyltransferase (GNAT) family protein n=1 Tax=Bogoriella caseilytica TaxID=56055 RepID=A0A3N2BF39_9MICO|nr:GNAT family N-acetyltransferase [Bogoriella caseilytica]ROR73883.1 acetyltransferase (GNAT) family protein [Bogoriella caseilytica]